ncbi:hypothetical protein H5410_040526 [Solanum commersonii]|uniref:Uncharacterized protein n=1 Tax=Solanum commersonii TaxID=4109 RepID=A0A9J5XRP1_SOLCO|nr:hypothetical protein H5410_040526 [Solanum commersonii]
MVSEEQRQQKEHGKMKNGLHKRLLLNLEKWFLIEESNLNQKSKARWIKLGIPTQSIYLHLMGSAAPTLPTVDISIMRRGLTLTLEQQTTLTRTKLTTREVIQTENVAF